MQGLPGIGGERTVRLQNTFGSVEAVITAAGQKLQTVEGIGDHIATKTLRPKGRSKSQISELLSLIFIQSKSLFRITTIDS